jgi:hypothetical protein
MMFQIVPDQVYFFNFKEVFIFNFLKRLYYQYIRFESADPGIVTVRRIFSKF